MRAVPLLCVTLLALLDAVDAVGGVRMLVVGDWGRQGSSDQRKVADAMGREAASAPLYAVLSTGDNFYEKGLSSPSDAGFYYSFQNVYTSSSLKDVSWYAVLGNHDYQGDPNAQMRTANSSYVQQRDPRWHCGYFYVKRFSAQVPGIGLATVEVAFIDTSPWVKAYRKNFYNMRANIADRDSNGNPNWGAWEWNQKAKLRNWLQRSTAQWKFVVGHHPIWSASKSHGNTWELQGDSGIEGLLKQYNVAAYFSGHDHNLQHIKRTDSPLQYIVSGAGSAVRADVHDNWPKDGSLKRLIEKPGFVTVVVTPWWAKMQLKAADGSEVKEFLLTRGSDGKIWLKQ